MDLRLYRDVTGDPRCGVPAQGGRVHTMHGAEQASAWVVLAAGVLCLAVGCLALSRRRWFVARSRRHIDARRFGLAQLSFAAMIFLETVPRLVHAAASIAFVASVLAIVPLALYVTMLFTALSLTSDSRFAGPAWLAGRSEGTPTSTDGPRSGEPT